MTYTPQLLIITFSETTINYIALAWLALAVIMFPKLLKTKSPYGRHLEPSKGLMIDNKLGWFLMELPAILIMLWFYLNSTNNDNKLVVTAFALWMLHYVNRTFIFPLRIRTKSKKMPVSVLLSGVFFNLMNGGLNGYWLAYLAPEQSPDVIRSPHFIIGVAIFITGFFINVYHDSILIGLRRDNTGYKIPYGGLFKYVSGPNYLGEIMEWLGFAILCWNLPALALLIWTAANLIPRSLNNHDWYHEKFEDYPKERKALIPFVL
ncbi:MAG: DUF1295 domain-containing protein [Chlorobi bacterium]|nr:DUF1295 domain-containing protein [Chlorobiota bacterium]